MNEIGDVVGQGALGRAQVRGLGRLPVEVVELLAAALAEDAQVLAHHRVLGVQEELVEGVGRGHAGIEPHGA